MSQVDKNTVHHVDDVKLQEKADTDTESLASVNDEPVCPQILMRNIG